MASPPTKNRTRSVGTVPYRSMKSPTTGTSSPANMITTLMAAKIRGRSSSGLSSVARSQNDTLTILEEALSR